MTDSTPSSDSSSPSVVPGRARIGSQASDRASRSWWDSDADEYHRTHGEFLGVGSEKGEFVWCPEGLHEGDV
ncbi:MAG: SAM-dependent methyltransferase, partial [Rhodococcus sp. (in: high G+C Gram-positive bacteria)]